ncbi:ABC transporter ATP-binding protein [[Clostridium] fimetarium]|uniref:ABC-2 type transport system ATP-binding protein n=1 Tax=[Clostridium] fimetarium TaxID=99656 RepID=A0A1I0NZV9_9FIRM|nr:ABC transporter ATP-binding protein [[Clostridium] fimetarium]SEW07489.1 ABC-2 type transport system ATP-binding protein [[Clostridium] fimetarium]
MKQGNAIEVKNLTKKFKVFFDKGSQLKERILFRNRNRYEERWVLNGVSFEVKKGEAIGLIGHNGCGKSTTLKLLSKIIYPDTGSIEMKGRVSSLIELGAGFHPDMSGRENVYTNASIFGLSKKEIDLRFDDIVAFSELEEFIDNPVRTYSSGMYMRLAFSVAINVNAEILLIDEILAVGDSNFQAKCFNRLREIKAHGTTIVIVSHSLSQIEQICDRTIWLQDGLIAEEGVPRDIHPKYLNYMGEQRQVIAEKEAERQKEKVDDSKGTKISHETVEKEKIDKEKNRWGNGNARIREIVMLNSKMEEQHVFATGDDMILKLEYNVKENVKDAVFGIGIFRGDGLQCYGTNTRIDKQDEFDLSESGMLQLNLKNIGLLPAEYIVDIAIESEIGVPVDYFKVATSFEVYSNIDDVGVVRIAHEWNFSEVK